MKPILGRLFFFWCFIALVATVPAAQAAQHVWNVDNRFSSGTELNVNQVYPDANVAVGESFSISIAAWSSANGVDAVEMSELTTYGCTILEQESADYNALGANLYAYGNARLLMTGPTCSWERTVFVNDTVLGTIARVDAVGTVTSYEMVELGRFPTRGFTGYVVPVLIFAIFAVLSLWNGWRLPALAATVGVFALHYEAAPWTITTTIFAFFLFLWLQFYADERRRNFNQRDN